MQKEDVSFVKNADFFLCALQEPQMQCGNAQSLITTQQQKLKTNIMKKRLLNLMNNQSLCTMARRCFASHQRLMLVALFTLCSIIGAQAKYTTRVEVDNYFYKLDLDNKIAQLVFDNTYLELTHINIPSTISFNGEEYIVNSIDQGVFWDFTKLDVITLPPTLTELGVNVFYNSSISRVEGLDQTQLTTIPANAFCRCRNLTSVDLPNTIQSIGGNAFSDCTKLESIYLPPSITELGHDVFSGSGVSRIDGLDKIPLTTIPASAFYKCANLNSIDLPNTIQKIERFAFYECPNLTRIAFGPVLKVIEKNAFKNCNALKTVITTSTFVIELGESAFESTALNKDMRDPIIIDYNLIDDYKGCGWEEYFNLTSINADQAVKLNNCFYRLDTNMTAQVVYDKTYKELASLDIPSEISFDGVVWRVNSIASNAFKDCAKLESISLPPSLLEIGNDAFALSGVSRIEGLDKTQLKTIPTRAFFACDNLTSVDLPNTIQKIGTYAFENCAKLESISLPPSLAELGEGAFKNSGVSRIEGLDKTQLLIIPPYAFFRCTNLTSVDLPNTIQQIRNSAFSECAMLESISLPPSLTLLGAFAFVKSSVSRIEGLDKTQLTSIPTYAFGICKNLTSVDLPNTIQEIGNSAFSECAMLESISLPPSLTELGEYAFAESGVSRIEGLDKTQLTIIPLGAFSKCTNLTSVDLPNTIQEIYSLAFVDCTNLARVSFGQNMKKIHYDAFRNCDALKTVTINSTSAIELGEDVFESKVLDKDMRDPIIIDYSLYDDYKKYGWEKYFNITYFGADMDANKDGSVNSADVTAIYNEIINGGATGTSAADVNGDGSVGSADVVAIYNYILRGQ